ncbi:profilin-4 [Ambystoma mexicanum]|uniref:profilin-4 n=1 Tax=Ambystoma mexicanum TaxID=8296 RepID=UPI0037E968F7
MSQLQSLLYESLILTKHVENAALLRIKDTKVAASTPGFNVQPQQAHMLIDAFKNSSLTRKEGLYFQNLGYKCVRADAQSIYGKYMDQGLVVVKTKTYVLVATYREGMFPSVCVEAVEKLGDYFKTKGK